MSVPVSSGSFLSPWTVVQRAGNGKEGHLRQSQTQWVLWINYTSWMESSCRFDPTLESSFSFCFPESELLLCKSSRMKKVIMRQNQVKQPKYIHPGKVFPSCCHLLGRERLPWLKSSCVPVGLLSPPQPQIAVSLALCISPTSAH